MSNYRFDLEKAIAGWRRPFEHNRAFSVEDIEELEGSLRDRVAALVEAGLAEEAAFRAAVGRMGAYGTAETEYRKVYWGKLKRQHQLKNELQWRLSMLKNYLKVAWRNVMREKGYAFINIAGLSIGMACCMLILLWVNDERSVDKFHPDLDRIYQVMVHVMYSETINTGAATPGVLAPALKEEVPELEYVASYTWDSEYLFRIGNESFKSTGIYAHPNLFHILHFDVLAGNSATWLQEPNTVVLSTTAAQRFFDHNDVIGQQLIVNNRDVYTVTGVYDDFPDNSSFRPGFIMPFEDFLKQNEWALAWGNNGPYAVAKLHENANPELVNEKIRTFIREKDEGALVDLFLFPYADRYLYNGWEDGRLSGGRIEHVRIFSIIALFILLIACINFTNLSTARSMRRAREIGVRKSVGASRGSLVGQYLGESVMISFFSLLVGLLLVVMTLPLFNNLTGKEISVSYHEPFLLLAFAGIALCTGLVAGSYPAFYLSAFEAVKSLKGTLRSSKGEAFIRKGLVVFQFVISIILIVSTIVIYNQVQYVQTINLGYQKDNLITFSLNGDRNAWWETFQNRALNLPGVTDVSRANSRFLDLRNGTTGIEWPGKDLDSSTDFRYAFVDYDLIETLGIEMAEGRSFSRDFGADSTAIIVNQAAVNVMGMGNPIGNTIRLWGNEREIIGVVEDFHYKSLRNEVEPMFMVLSPPDASDGFVRVETDDISQTLSQIEQVHTQVNPAFPFEYTFMDESYASLYESEMRVGEISKYFALFAVLISCLGLFGLSAFTAQQRRKEIGIRKVMGASIRGLVTMLSKDFILLMLMSMLIALPVSWWVMNRWLEDYAYHIEIGPGVFLLTGVLVLLIALLTVSYQSTKAALADPVKSLRYE
jgi:putative ABC transport system permease protein